MRFRELEDAVDAALERIDAAMGGEGGEKAAVLPAERALLMLASLDVPAGEVQAVSERVALAYTAQVVLGGLDDLRVVLHGCFMTGYVVGRLHDPEAGS